MKNIIIMSFSLVFFIACGNDSNNTKDEPLPINVPEKIDIKMPDALKGNRSIQQNKNIFQKTSNSTVESNGYTSIKKSILKTEKTILKTNQLFSKYESMMPNIIESCTDTKINEQCTIIEPQFTDFNITIEPCTDTYTEEACTNNQEAQYVSLHVTKILYTQNNSTHTFQHSVTLHFALERDLIVNSKTLKWSEDNNFITTIEHKETSDSRGSIQLDYQKQNDGSSSMQIHEIFGSHKYEYGESMFNIENINDINRTVKIQDRVFAIYAGLFSGYSTRSIISKNGGYLSYKEVSDDLNKTSIEKEYFDATGKLLDTKFCYSNKDNCDIKDESTWQTYSSEFEESNEGSFPDNNISIYDFEVKGGELHTGYCELLPSAFEIKATMSLEETLSHVVATIVKDNTKSEGIIYDKNYSNKLNSLKIICFIDTEYKEYIELLGTDRPILTPYR